MEGVGSAEVDIRARVTAKKVTNHKASHGVLGGIHGYTLQREDHIGGQAASTADADGIPIP